MPKAVRFSELGGPEVLKLEEVPAPMPGKGEVLLTVAAVGLNRADSMYFHGQYWEKPVLPSGLGYEVVGTVTAVGPGEDGSLVGRQVATVPGYSINKYPALGEVALASVADLAPVPKHLSSVETAAVWMQYGTAYSALVPFGKVGEGDFVLITAASSSVGLAAIQIAKAQGGVAIATTRRSKKKQRLLELGADHVIATEEEDLPARLREITGGKMARVVYDPVGGDFMNTLGQATANEGIIFLYGMLSGQPTPFPISTFGRGVALRSSSIGEMRQPQRFAEMKRWILERLENGTLKPEVDRVFPLDQVVDAYKYLESNEQVGKVVIEVNT